MNNQAHKKVYSDSTFFRLHFFQAGASAKAGIYLSYGNGKFFFRAAAGACVGVGASGNVLYSVDFANCDKVWDFVYHALKNNNFDYLTFVQPAAFKILQRSLLWAFLNGTTLGQAASLAANVNALALQIEEWWASQQANYEAAQKIIDRTKNKPALLAKSPPEVKGRMLRILCETTARDLLDRDSWGLGEMYGNREEAANVVLSTIESRNNYQETLQHMTMGSQETISANEGRRILLGLLDGKEQREFEQCEKVESEKVESE